MYRLLLFLAAIMMISASNAPVDTPSVPIALLKYNGGGDWYANPTSLPNLIDFCNRNLGTNIARNPG
ncbi:MAG: hypothetical protein R6V49_07985 [Bacteroidales bacterium]